MYSLFSYLTHAYPQIGPRVSRFPRHHSNRGVRDELALSLGSRLSPGGGGEGELLKLHNLVFA